MCATSSCCSVRHAWTTTLCTCSLPCLVLTGLLRACVQLQGRKGQGAQRPPRGGPGHNVYPGSVPRSQARGIKR